MHVCTRFVAVVVSIAALGWLIAAHFEPLAIQSSVVLTWLESRTSEESIGRAPEVEDEVMSDPKLHVRCGRERVEVDVCEVFSDRSVSVSCHVDGSVA